MKHIPLSVNAPLGNIKALERTGYDCIEPSNTDITAMEEAEFLSAAESLEASRLRCVVIDNPMPCSVSFAAENWELASWEDYLRLSAKRAVRLGAKYWCFGNGTSRALPGEAEADARVMENFRAAVLLCADIASDHGISVIVEPSARVSRIISRAWQRRRSTSAAWAGRTSLPWSTTAGSTSRTDPSPSSTTTQSSSSTHT